MTVGWTDCIGDSPVGTVARQWSGQTGVRFSTKEVIFFYQKASKPALPLLPETISLMCLCDMNRYSFTFYEKCVVVQYRMVKSTGR